MTVMLIAMTVATPVEHEELARRARVLVERGRLDDLGLWNT